MRWGWLVVGVLVLAACGSRADEARSAGESTTTTRRSTTTSTAPTTTTPTADAQPGPPVSARATESGIEVALTIEHGEVDAGSRVWAELTITNVGDERVYWQAGGCGNPGGFSVEPAGETPAAAWGGDPATFADAVGRWTPTVRFQAQANVGWRDVACTSDSVMQAFEPGDHLTQRAAADVRVPRGPLPAGGDYVVRAGFTSYASPGDYGYQETDHPRPRATVSVPLHVRDVDRGDADAAVRAFASSDQLARFVDETRTTSVANTWATELSWWRGAWELWVEPTYAERNVGALRLRFDPATAAITDARIVWSDLAPEDDPDATRPPGTHPDEVR